MMMPFNCQVPQAPTPLLIPPLNQLALLLVARAPGENAENAQDEVAQGPEQRKITAAIMKEWGPHKALRALGAHEFHGACADPLRNGEASHADANGALDAAVKAKLNNYQHDYNERNFFFLPAVMTTSGR